MNVTEFSKDEKILLSRASLLLTEEIKKNKIANIENYLNSKLELIFNQLLSRDKKIGEFISSNNTAEAKVFLSELSDIVYKKARGETL